MCRATIQEPILPVADSSSAQHSSSLSDAQQKRCLRVWCFFCFGMTFSAQTFLTLLPLLVTDGLHREILMSGVVQTAQVVASMISFALLTPLLKRFSPRSLAIYAQGLRVVSSTIFAVFVENVRVGPWTFPVIIGTRFVFGLASGAVGLAAIWVGHHYAPKERPRAIASYSAATGIGAVLGPVGGSLLQTATPNILIESALSGWSNVAVSVLLALLMRSCFDE